MPAANPGTGQSGTRRIRKQPNPPDTQDRNKQARRRISPDQEDRQRSPAQQVRDRVAVARNVRVSREKFVTKRGQQTARAIITGRGGKVVDASKEFEAARGRAQQQRAERLAPAITVLEQLSRPTHAVAAAAREDVRDIKAGRLPVGHGSLKAAAKGFKLEDKSTFSDVLADLGVENKVAKGVGGFALDVLLDPTTYVSFGTTSVARKGAENAARKATKKALKSGASKKSADRAGRAAAKSYLAKGRSNRGLTAGFGGRRTSGRGTAAISRALKIPQGSEKLRGALPGRLVRHVAPTVRPAGVEQKAFDKVRAAMVRGRAITSLGEKRARNRAQAIARILPGDKHPQITDALENLGERLPSREEFIAGRPKASRNDPEPTVEGLTQNVKEGRPGFAIEPIHLAMTDPATKARVDWGPEMAGAKVVVWRDPKGKPQGALHILLDEHGKPDILQVAVNPEFRGKGLGSSLYEFAQKQGLDVESASGRGGYTEAGAALAHKRLTARSGDPLEGLTDAERKVVAALKHDYDEMYRAEHGRGLVGAKFREFGYSPRRAISELEPTGSRKRMGGAQLESSKARTNRRKYADFRGTDDDIYTENAALAYYLRARDSAVKIGRKEVIDTLHGIGRRWHPGVALKDGEEIYKFAPRKMPVKVEGDELKSLMRGGAPPGLNEYRVLHRDLVKTAEQGIPERLEGLEELGRIWDRQIQGRVKTVLTVVNPQYHMTNLYGDLWNAYLGAPAVQLARDLGISVRALTYRARREAAAKTLAKQIDPAKGSVKINGQRVSLDKLIKEAEEHGAVNQGFIGRDLAEVLDRQGKEAAARMGRGKIARHTRIGGRIATSRVGSKIAHPIDTVRDASQYREDAVRLALYLGRRRKGDTPDEAARFTNRHLFDYGDLTQFEKSVLRRVLPFYTFTARNTPLQVRSLLERPGKYANLEKVREETQKASQVPEGYEGDLEKYEQQGVPIPVPGASQLLYPKLPVTDLNRLTVKDQGNFLMAMLTPLIKTPVELDQNYSFFLRRKIDELVGEKGPNGETVEQLKPAPPVILELLKRAPGGESIAKALRLVPYTDKRTGKRVIGWPAKLDYVWRSTPATSFAGQAGQQIPNTRGQTPGQATFGYMTGLKVVPYSPPEVKKKRAGEAYGYLQAKAKSMRDRGTAYDSKGNRTPAYQRVLDASKAAYAVIDPNPPKRRASNMSPEAAAALENMRKSLTAGGGMSPEAQAALENLRKP